MKNLFTITLLLLSVLSYAQNELSNDRDYQYFKFDLDANKLIGFHDNPDTVVDNRGLDFDIEIGARYKSFRVYAFFGAFNSTTTESEFYNYGAGVDYIPNLFRWVDMSIGVSYSPMFKKDLNNNWSPVGSIAFRAQTIIWFHPDSKVGLSLRANFIDASDKDSGIRKEGSIGIVLRGKLF